MHLSLPFGTGCAHAVLYRRDTTPRPLLPSMKGRPSGKKKRHFFTIVCLAKLEVTKTRVSAFILPKPAQKITGPSSVAQVLLTPMATSLPRPRQKRMSLFTQRLISLNVGKARAECLLLTTIEGPGIIHASSIKLEFKSLYFSTKLLSKKILR